jgi:WhiB family transcriptional regulator, redox-sensing transcriptional regulator
VVRIPRAAPPTAPDWRWQASGACRRADPELFFHPDAERGAARTRRDAAALRVCAACPVLRRCREHALAQPEVDGVWGGLTEEQRLGVGRTAGDGPPAP